MKQSNILKYAEAEDLNKYREMLPLPFADVIYFYCNDGLTQQEIGDKMNISVYKVRLYLSKGMYLLKKAAGDPELRKAEIILNTDDNSCE